MLLNLLDIFPFQFNFDFQHLGSPNFLSFYICLPKSRPLEATLFKLTGVCNITYFQCSVLDPTKTIVLQLKYERSHKRFLFFQPFFRYQVRNCQVSSEASTAHRLCAKCVQDLGYENWM